MKSIIIFFLLSIFCITASIGQVKIPLSENMNLKECKASDYISSIQYIPLETTDDCLLGGELQVIATSGKNGNSGLTDDLTHGPLITPPDNTNLYESSIPGRLIYWINPSDIDATQYQKGEFGKVIKQVDEDSNPIIRVINLK